MMNMRSAVVLWAVLGALIGRGEVVGQVGTMIDDEALQTVGCFAWTAMPPVRLILDQGRTPAVIVSGRVVGFLQRPDEPCPDPAALPDSIGEIRFIRPAIAREIRGKVGADGLLIVDLHGEVPQDSAGA